MDLQLAVLDPGALLSFTTADVVAEVARGARFRFVVPRIHQDSVATPTPFVEYKTLANEEQIRLLLAYATVATEDEAAAAALAQSCGLPLISDEPKLRRCFAASGSGFSLLATAELLQRWQSSSPDQTATISAVINALVTRSHYSPASSLPGSKWLRQR